MFKVINKNRTRSYLFKVIVGTLKKGVKIFDVRHQTERRQTFFWCLYC